MPRIHQKLLIFLCAAVFSTEMRAAGGWSFNLGYHNPNVSTYGVNFLHLWSEVAFEVGIGMVRANASDNNDTNNDNDNQSFAIAGDFDFKYLFSTGGIRPYVQAGLGYSAGAKVGGSKGIDAGGLFYGLGLFLIADSVYVYGSYNLNENEDSHVQAGVGFGM